MEVWTEPKDKTVEGHTLMGTLKFKNQTIWGPHGCHANTVRLDSALRDADSRFAMTFQPKAHSVEGHSRYISVKDWNGEVLLDKLSTHNNMDSLVRAVSEAARHGPA